MSISDQNEPAVSRQVVEITRLGQAARTATATDPTPGTHQIADVVDFGETGRHND